jgi:putative DNA primase/helicase
LVEVVMNAVPEWLPKVDAAIERYAGASASVQEGICQKLAEGWGPEAGAKARELFARVRERRVEPPIEPAVVEPVVVDARLSFLRRPRYEKPFYSGAKPKPDPADPDDPVEPALQPPAEEPKEEEGEPLREAAKGLPGVLDPKAPLDSARVFVTLRHWHREERVPRLRFWQRQFWMWSGMHWRPFDEDTTRSRLYEFLDLAEKLDKRGKPERYEPTITEVNKVIDALRAQVNLEPSWEMPGWLKGEAPVENLKELVACRNGLLYLPDRRLLRHSPRFWSPNVLEFDYEPEARAPRFERFLEELWPRDGEAQQSFLEMVGLCITDETKYQTAFMFVGPRRGGRGTIGRLLRGLIGAENYVRPSLHQFSDQFGLQSLIGKKVAVFSDARLDGITRKGLSVIAERLLSITGEDVLDINRKYHGYWSGMLRARVIILSNELLRFQDDSGALASRFSIWRMEQSFRGREERDLTAKLLAERAGILNLALDALARLKVRGRLVQPGTGGEMVHSLATLTSDIAAFVEDVCVVGPSCQASVQSLFTRWQDWCGLRGIRHGWGPNQFSEKLRSSVPTIRSYRPRDNPGRGTVLTGIRSRKAGE